MEAAVLILIFKKSWSRFWDTQSQRSMQQRYTGVSQGLRESGAVVEWSLEGKAEIIKDAFYTLEQDKPVDILIALGNDETEMMVDFFAGDELGSSFVGGERHGCHLPDIRCHLR